MPKPLTGSRFAARIKECLAEGQPVSRAAAARLLRQAGALKICESDAVKVVTEYWKGRDRFHPEDRQRLEVFLTRSLAASIVPDTNTGVGSRSASVQPDPASLVFSSRQARYESPGGAVVRQGISFTDPVQGMGEDCFLIAALSAVARACPDRIREILKENPDGTFTATFFGRRTGQTGLEPFEVAIDGQLPLTDGRVVFAKSKDRGERWPGLVEKAYAKWKGDYTFCFDDESGMPGDALSALTGKDPRYMLVLPTSDPDQVFRELEQALGSSACVIAGTRVGEELDPSEDLEAGHEYTVLAVRDHLGERAVQVRNPRGVSRQTCDGVQWISLKAFVDHFDLIDIVQL